MKPETKKVRQEFLAENVTLELTREEVTVVVLALRNQRDVEMEYAENCRNRAKEWGDMTDVAEDDLRLAAEFEKDAADLEAVFRKIAGYDMPPKTR